MILNDNVNDRSIMKSESIIQQTKYLENDVIHRAISSNANDVENENENIKFRNVFFAMKMKNFNVSRDNNSKQYFFHSFTIF